MDIYNRRKGLKITMRGPFVEIKEQEKWRFLELYVMIYSPEDLQRLKEMGVLEDSRLGEYLRLIDAPILPHTQYLYKLKTYYGKKGHTDSWAFNNDMTNYQTFGFQHIDEVLNFCRENWGITEADFKPLEETSIPH